MSLLSNQRRNPPAGAARCSKGPRTVCCPSWPPPCWPPEESVIHNCPDLSDVTATLDILRLLGCGVSREGDTVALDARELDGTVIPASLMGELRSSVIFLGALLTRMGEVELSYPGGCELGPRPIDLHLGALRQLGAEIREEGGSLLCRRGKEMRGRELCLSLPAWGPQRTSCWPLWLSWPDHSGGGRPGAGDRRPSGVPEGHGCTGGGGGDAGHLHRGRTAPPPRGTYRNRRPNCRCDLSVRSRSRGGRDRDHGSGPGPPDSGALRTPGGGLRVETGAGEIRLTCYSPLRAIRPVRTAPHPGFPTDAQAILMPPWPAGLGALCLWRTSFPAVTTM